VALAERAPASPADARRRTGSRTDASGDDPSLILSDWTALELAFAACGRPSHSTSHSNLSSAAHREMVKGLQRSQESEGAKQGDPTVALVRSRK
jgi:hypothetical protein